MPPQHYCCCCCDCFNIQRTQSVVAVFLCNIEIVIFAFYFARQMQNGFAETFGHIQSYFVYIAADVAGGTEHLTQMQYSNQTKLNYPTNSGAMPWHGNTCQQNMQKSLQQQKQQRLQEKQKQQRNATSTVSAHVNFKSAT